MARNIHIHSSPWARRLCLALVGLFVLSSALVITHHPQVARANPVVSTDWMARAGYGVAMHWTSQSIPSTGGSPAAYCTAVNNFNVNTLAQQLSDAGAGYLLFTISHAQQYFAFPSAKLDSVISGRTCTRDLYSDIYNAIHPLGIKLMFYYPSIATSEDPSWQTASQWNSNPSAFAQLQYDLVTEIGNRYGTKLDGWWVDNCFDGGYGSKYNFTTYANALRAGNANRLVTFNFKGQGTWNSTTGQGIEDYAAGESVDLSRLPSSRYSGEGGTQWQTLIAMDNNNWVLTSGSPSPSFSDASVIDYATNIAAHQGAFTYNASAYQDTLIGTATLNQLKALKAARRGTRVEDTSATYSGTWNTISNTAYSGGADHYSTVAGAYAQYSFTGTGVVWYGVVGTDHGKADVYLDGSSTPDATIDCYDTSWRAQEPLYTKTGLTSGTHTIKIVVRSDRNAAATNNFVEVDALGIITVVTAPPKTDDTSASVSYTGTWNTIANSAYYGGTDHYTTTASSYAQYSFTGTGVTWYGISGQDHGKADVYLDGSGTPDATVDCYASTWGVRALYTKNGLSNGSHTLKIVVRSDRNAAATNNYIEVDAFDNGSGGSGGTNFASGATVTASSDVGSSDWAKAKVNDGQRHAVSGAYGWTSSNSTGSNHTEWVTLNFGSAKSFSRVDLYPRDDGANAGYGFPIDFTIAVSNDGTNWTTVVTRTGYALPSGVQSFTFTSQTAQYVRVQGTNLRQNPNDTNFYRLQFAEIEVY
ncbi:MAG: discoidin domain-containing protein [Ktedonobacterales bacterium]|nr:discoidin domain-containing protein [Ktedonobacterales bacterium]